MGIISASWVGQKLTTLTRYRNSFSWFLTGSIILIIYALGHKAWWRNKKHQLLAGIAIGMMLCNCLEACAIPSQKLFFIGPFPLAVWANAYVGEVMMKWTWQWYLPSILESPFERIKKRLPCKASFLILPYKENKRKVILACSYNACSKWRLQNNLLFFGCGICKRCNEDYCDRNSGTSRRIKAKIQGYCPRVPGKTMKVNEYAVFFRFRDCVLSLLGFRDCVLSLCDRHS